jgi:hypothetical protein
MLRERRKAGDQVAESLFEAEAAIDNALAKTATLAGRIPMARREAHLSALFGQEVIERISDTIAALTHARRGIVETHKGLAAVQRQLGLGAVAYGGNESKPNPAVAPGPDLSPVRTEAA